MWPGDSETDRRPNVTTMRILYASERPPYPFFLGGAARCAHQLLLTLTRDFGAQCTAVGSSDYTVTPWAYPPPTEHLALGILSVAPACETLNCGYPVQVIPDYLARLDMFIHTFKPDVVWAQLEGAYAVLKLARQKGVQGLFYVHDAEFDPNELRAIADLGCHIICSSAFLAEKARKTIGRETHVVYPATELYFGTASNPDGYMTMINPFRVKGIETFLDIAQRLPSERFMLVESWKLNDAALAALQERLTPLSNVRLVRRVSDMRTIYGQTKLLLVPSVWEEGFGMVAVEAQSCRIPVIASARGGLPESVGDGGLLIADYLNTDSWLAAINQVLMSKESYQTFTDLAFNHVTGDTLSPAVAAQRFLDVCSSVAPPQKWTSTGARGALQHLQKVPFVGKFFRRP